MKGERGEREIEGNLGNNALFLAPDPSPFFRSSCAPASNLLTECLEQANREQPLFC